MPWPQDKLDVLVELGIDGQWTPSAQDVYGHDRASIEITRGRSNLASRLEAGRCSLQFNNRDGKYSPRNPRSPYFGKIGRNTPLRVWARGDKPYLWIPGSPGQRARVASSPSLDVTEDLDVRIELSLDNIPTQGELYEPQLNELVGRYNATGTPGNRSWRLAIEKAGTPDLTWSTTGDDFHEVWAAGHPVPYFAGQRFALRATLDVDNGSGGHTVTFYTAPTIDGPWTMLGDPITNAGVTSIHPPGDASLEIGDINTIYFAPGQGRYYALQLRDGIDGPLLADPDFTAQADYSPEFTDGVGNLWQMVGGALIEPYYRRFVGEVSEWPQRWQGGGVDAWTDIEAAGALRRYRQGAKPLQSTLRRRIPSGGDQLAPLSYWPMEEGRDATQAYSPLPGVGPLHTTGLNWDSDSSLFGSDSLPTLGKGASLRGNIGPGFIQGGWTVDMSYQLDKLPDTEMQMMRVLIAGGPVALAKVLVSAGGIRVVGYDSDNNIVADVTLTDPGALAAFTGGWNRLQFASAVSGDRTYLVAHWRNVITGVRWFAATSYAGGPGVISSLATYFGGDLQGMAIGHIGMWGIGSTVTSTSPLAISPGITYFDDADDAFESESAVSRLIRLAEEEDLLLSVKDGPGESEHLGPQQVATLLDNVQDAADADGGLLLEQRETLGFQYRQRETLYNRPPALVLDYTVTGEVEHPFEPVDDDSELANDRTVTRRGGSSGRAALETGPLSVQAPPQGVGVYDDSVTLSLASDAQAAQIAGWRLHLGTVDEARYPRVTINLRTAPQLIEPVMSLDVGDIIQVINLPEFLPPGPVLLRVEGYTETINAFDWKITFNCSPASPWTVGTVAPDDPAEAGTDGANRADTSGSELSADAAAADTVLVVHTPQDGQVSHAVWTEDPAETPFDLSVAGETVRVNTTGGLAQDDFTRTVTGGWGTSTSGHVYSSAGSAAANWSVDGARGLFRLDADAEHFRAQLMTAEVRNIQQHVTLSVDALTSGGFTPGVVMRHVDTPNNYQARVHFLSSGGLSVSLWRGTAQVGSTTATGLSYGPGTRVHLRAQVVEHTVSARVWIDGTPEPDTWAIVGTVTDSPIEQGGYGCLMTGFNTNTDSGFPCYFDDYQVARTAAVAPLVWDTFGRTLPVVYLSDTFERTVTGGWGTADSGQAWTVEAGDAATFNVSGGTARQDLSDTGSHTTISGMTPVADVDATVTMTFPAVAAGAAYTTGLILRHQDPSTYYHVRAIAFTNTMGLWLTKVTTAGQSDITTDTYLGAYTAGQQWTLRARLQGATLEAKMWPTLDAEPDGWQVTGTDSEITGPGIAGVRSYLGAGNTNTKPVTMQFDELHVTGLDKWGTSASGDVWRTSGGSVADFAVSGGTGQITLTDPITSVRFAEQLVDATDCEVLMCLSVDQTASGGDLLAGALLRGAGAVFYWCDVVFGADNSIGIEVRNVVTIEGARVITRWTYAPGDRVWLRARVVGAGRVLGRVWLDGDPEPGDWHVDRTLTTGLSASGSVGVAAAGTGTNTNPTVSVHSFRIVDPQTMTVTRAVNGVVKDQLAGADVRLAQPAVAAL